jgi:hypothetical protein
LVAISEVVFRVASPRVSGIAGLDSFMNGASGDGPFWLLPERSPAFDLSPSNPILLRGSERPLFDLMN